MHYVNSIWHGINVMLLMKCRQNTSFHSFLINFHLNYDKKMHRDEFFNILVSIQFVFMQQFPCLIGFSLHWWSFYTEYNSFSQHNGFRNQFSLHMHTWEEEKTMLNVFCTREKSHVNLIRWVLITFCYRIRLHSID